MTRTRRISQFMILVLIIETISHALLLIVWERETETSFNSRFSVKKIKHLEIVVNIKSFISAPPFIKSEFPETVDFVITEDEEALELVCDVECDPLCDVYWMVNEEYIEEEEGVEILETVHTDDADSFSSIISTLSIASNHSWLKNENLSINCITTNNDVGDSVYTSTSVNIECK